MFSSFCLSCRHCLNTGAEKGHIASKSLYGIVNCSDPQKRATCKEFADKEHLAACAAHYENRELFFSDEEKDIAFATGVCMSGCEIFELCREFAVDKSQLYGIWGGTTEKERRGLRNVLKRGL